MDQFAALIIFIRNPVLGTVKTRIAQNSSPENALDIYNKLLDICHTECLAYPGDKFVYYSDSIDPHDQWHPDLFYKRLQHGQDLGDRIAHAFQEVLINHSKAIIIGSDCPYLKNELILDANNYLNSKDCVIGPAADGGYYLLGLKKFEPKLFQDKPWSRPELFGETLQAMSQLQLEHEMLETLEDIDTQEDWNRYLDSTKL